MFSAVIEKRIVFLTHVCWDYIDIKPVLDMSKKLLEYQNVYLRQAAKLAFFATVPLLILKFVINKSKKIHWSSDPVA